MKLSWTTLYVALAAAIAGGCATKRDVDSLRGELAHVRSRQDSISVKLAELDQTVATATDEQRTLVLEVRGDLLRQLDDMERQLVAIQELLGQSQIVLRGLRERTQQRQEDREEGEEGRAEGDTLGAAPVRAGAEAGGEAARSLYAAAIDQLRRGAFNTARGGFQEFLVSYPAHELAPDAQYNLAETYREEGAADQAIREYNRVIELYPNSQAAPTALYKAGLLQMGQGNKDLACQYFQRVLAGYPRSDESRLARDQAERLSCR